MSEQTIGEALVSVVEKGTTKWVKQRTIEGLAERIRENLERGQTAALTFIDTYFLVGHDLIAAKDQLNHGEWYPWLEREFNRSPRWATLLMQAAENESAVRDQIGSQLLISGSLNLEKAVRAALGGERQPRNPHPPPLPVGLWNVIYADPPWRYESATAPPDRAIENQYPTMTLDEIMMLDLPVADDAILFMWATSPKLVECLEVVAEWGFHYRTCMVWVKDRIGLGYYTRQKHELLLVAIKGDMPAPVETALQPSVIEAPRGAHSEKPGLFHDLIEALYPGFAYLELFARKPRPGWTSWGNEV